MRFAAVSIFSILSNADTPAKIYCIVPSTDIFMVSSIQEMNRIFDSDIQIIAADNQIFSTWTKHAHVTRAAYLRLLIPNLIREEKVIYLDSDLIVLSDLSELYATSTEQFFLAGVPDPRGASSSKMPRKQDDVYINSGVLVMNLEGLRQDHFLQKCAQINASYPGLATWVDQCLINKYAENRKVIIDAKWNRQIIADEVTLEEFNNYVSNGNSSIIHFLGRMKPWNAGSGPHVAKFWWDYADRLSMKLGRTGFPWISRLSLVRLRQNVQTRTGFPWVSRISLLRLRQKVRTLLNNHGG
jgi:lipopolysaccharide biosynthesis glycosyltransferase